VFHQRKVAVQAWILATATLYSYFATAIGDRLKLNGRPVPLNSSAKRPFGLTVTFFRHGMSHNGARTCYLWRIAAQEPHDVGIPYKAQEALRPYERMLNNRKTLPSLHLCMYISITSFGLGTAIAYLVGKYETQYRSRKESRIGHCGLLYRNVCV
jgi:hypothetical protein